MKSAATVVKLTEADQSNCFVKKCVKNEFPATTDASNQKKIVCRKKREIVERRVLLFLCVVLYFLDLPIKKPNALVSPAKSQGSNGLGIKVYFYRGYPPK